MLSISYVRVFALCKRYLATFFHLGQVQDLFFWPSFDIFIWGMAGSWMQRGDHHLVPIFLTAIVLWQCAWRNSYEISMGLMEEIWNRNLVNLFATPIKLSEWVLAVMLMGILKMLITATFAWGFICLLYDYNVLNMGWFFLPHAFLLILSGWTIGFIATSCIIAMGNRGYVFTWMIPYAFIPFSGVYYPADILPVWAQHLSKFLPMTYIFASARSFFLQGTMLWENLITAFGLSCLYLPLALLLFVYTFKRARTRGLARLE